VLAQEMSKQSSEIPINYRDAASFRGDEQEKMVNMNRHIVAKKQRLRKYSRKGQDGFQDTSKNVFGKAFAETAAVIVKGRTKRKKASAGFITPAPTPDC
jgi:hypothetical protein